MKYKIIYILIVTLCFSCKKDYTDEHYDSGKLKFRTYKVNDAIDSIISFHEKGDIDWIKKIYNKDSLYLWEYDGNKLLKDGVIFKNEAFGNWNFYKNNYLEVVREYIRLDEHHYFNQSWYFNKQGDTLDNKGSYYKINFNDTIKTETEETIRIFLERPLFNAKENEMIVIYEAEFYNNRTKEIEKDSDTILGVNNEVLYQITFRDEGEFSLKGHILEQYEPEDKSGIGIHKLYFDKKIKIIN